MISKTRTNVIYIAGGGHSGSTLLDRIIGCAPQVFTVGEARHYSDYVEREKEGASCTCLKPFRQCAFWSSVQKDSGGEFHLVRDAGIKAYAGMALKLFFPSPVETKKQTPPQDNAGFFQSVAGHAKTLKPELRYVLDSSKDVWRLYALAQSMKENLFVIHLIRDARGYAYSYNSPQRRKEKLKVKSALYSCMEWLAVNALAKRIIQKFQLKHVTISYDLFCTDPKRYVSFLNEALGIAIPEDYASALRRTEYHHLDGNVSRFNAFEGVVYDTRFRSGFPAWKSALMTAALYPFHKRWVCKDDVTNVSSSPAILP